MITCNICLDELRSPVSIPCGHVFCEECLNRTISAVNSFSKLHVCPKCRSTFTSASPDPMVIPPSMQYHPDVRRLYLDENTLTSEASSSTITKSSTEAREQLSKTNFGRLTAENTALRENAAMWRRRAEIHSASNLGFLQMAKHAKSQAKKAHRQRDEMQSKYDALKTEVGLEGMEYATLAVGYENSYARSIPSMRPQADWPDFQLAVLENDAEVQLPSRSHRSSGQQYRH